MPFVILTAESSRDTLIQLDPQFLEQLPFMLFNSFVLIIILVKLLYNPVKKFLAERAERIATQLAEAEAAKTAALTMEAELNEKYHHVDAERDMVLSEARRIAHDRESRIISDAKREAELIMERAAMEIERDRLRSAAEIKAQIVNVSTLLTERYIKGALDKSVRDELMGEAIIDLGEAQWIN